MDKPKPRPRSEPVKVRSQGRPPAITAERSQFPTPVVDDSDLVNTPLLSSQGLDVPVSLRGREASAPIVDPRQIGRFTVLKRLGSGGMGVVYAAYDPNLDRRVALKLLRARHKDARKRDAAQTRLRREAQAMAKLSHPNVVAIYEVGTLDDQVFIAMEFVKGMTLTKWLAQHPVANLDEPVDNPRLWREVLDIYMQAGRGLAAAHRAGIIHRDFKPDNVLIGRDGRVRVVDFGLARAESSEATGTRLVNRPDTFADAIKMASRSILGLRITRTGGMTGTPAYMAPEQYTKRKIDTRTDQFSFCVALYEGLYGERPFKGETVSEVRKQVVGGLVDEEPPGTDVPQWLRRVVLRGLSIHPGERYPSMDALLADLTNDTDATRQRSRRKVLFAVGVIAILAVAGLGYNRALTAGYERAQAEKLDQCTAANRLLVGIWDNERKQTIRSRFLASGVSYAGDTWQRVEQTLDRYTEQWAALRNESCAATHIEHTQSEQVFDQRSLCFDRQLNALRALSELFAREGDRQPLVDKAVSAARSLPVVSMCSDADYLVSGAPPPDDPAQRRLVEELRKQLSEVEVSLWAGQYRSGLKRAIEIVEEADQLNYMPLRAEAWRVRGALEEESGMYNEAERSLRKAIFAAEASRHDEEAVRALTLQVRVVGDRLARHQEALSLEGRLRAALIRLGDNSLRKAEALNNLGRVYASQGDYQAAADSHEKAVELGAELFPDGNHPLVANFLLDWGSALEKLGKHEEASDHFLRALRIIEDNLGELHPGLASPLTSLGSMALHREDYKTAMTFFDRVRKLLEGTVEKDHPDMARPLYGLGVAYEHRGRWRKASFLFRQSLRIWEKAQGQSHPQLAYPLLGLCRVLARRGQYQSAFESCTRALNIRETMQIDPTLQAEARFELAQITWEMATRRGAPDAEQRQKNALALAARAREAYAQASPKDKESIERIDGWLEDRRGDGGERSGR